MGTICILGAIGLSMLQERMLDTFLGLPTSQVEGPKNVTTGAVMDRIGFRGILS